MVNYDTFHPQKKMKCASYQKYNKLHFSIGQTVTQFWWNIRIIMTSLVAIKIIRKKGVKLWFMNVLKRYRIHAWNVPLNSSKWYIKMLEREGNWRFHCCSNYQLTINEWREIFFDSLKNICRRSILMIKIIFTVKFEIKINF